MKRWFAGLVALLGCGLVAFAISLAPEAASEDGRAADTVIPPAGFRQVELTGLVVRPPVDARYQPSAAITAAAALHRQGIWPLQGQWRELPPPGPARAVVVLLHGAGRNGLSMLEMWQATGQRQDLVLVAPESHGKTWGRGWRDAGAIRRAALAAAGRHGVPADRIFLFGHSDGAAMAQWLLTDDPAPWRAVALHGGFLPAHAFGPARGSVPLRLYLGRADHIFALDGAAASGTAMAARGHPTELLTIAGHTHWFYQIGPQIADHAWDWFAGR